MTGPIILAEVQRWIGAEENAEETLTAGLVARFNATLSLDEGSVQEQLAPRLIHFCLCQPAASMAMLGEDGHPARGNFIPPIPLPRRMWAGSEIRFEGDLRIGDTVRRASRIADVAVKEGRTGSLCFVTVEHSFSVDGELRIEDHQTIVYRALQAEPVAAGAAAPAGETVVALKFSPALLFRYSALTFNGHRIHYDSPYATEIEGYPGLVVHGPLQATLLFHLAARIKGRQPDRFTFRSRSTLFDGEEVRLNADKVTDDSLLLWTAGTNGPVAMQAKARWS